MPLKISVFRSPEGEARYQAAYQAALKLWPTSYEELCIPTRLGETHVIASGSIGAPALLLLHPAGCGSIIWYRNVGALSRRYRTYAVDTMSEVNLSRPSRAFRGRADFTSWMEDLLDGLQIQKACLVGNSFGGYVALQTALSRPERVQKVVLISPAATFDPMWALYRHFSPAFIIRSLTGSPELLLRSYEWIWQGFPLDDCIAELRLLTALEGRMCHGAPTVFTDDELRALRTPVLLLIGDHEVIYPPERVIEEAARRVAGLQVQIIPNANHNAEYTNAEAVNQKILEFLAA